MSVGSSLIEAHNGLVVSLRDPTHTFVFEVMSSDTLLGNLVQITDDDEVAYFIVDASFQVKATALAATNIPLSIVAAGSQSADLLDVFASDGTTKLFSIDSAGVIQAANGLTMADAKNIALGSSTGNKIGTAITQKMGFYNAAPIAQRAGSAQAAVVTTGATNSTPYGFTTAAQADAIVALVNELRAWAVAQGFIKGAA